MIEEEIESYFDRLWPITRSLTGNGNRRTLEILSEILELKVKEVPSGTECFDWTVPPEWNIKEAWIKNSKGEKIVDIANNNLHILNYSEPFKGIMKFDELRPHLYSLPNQPDLIPYLTSYYKRAWGFCLSHDQLSSLDQDEEFEIFIDSTLDENGSMTVAEAYIEGSSDQEIIFSTYICHPSLANNELSGPLVASFLYRELKMRGPLKYNYRFLFVPETIGSIYALTQYGEHWKEKLAAGFVITCIGDAGQFTYKRSRRGNSLPDKAVECILNQTEDHFTVSDYFPTGSDERQYCSPGFNLPVGSLMRTRYGKYKEYHTSADNREFISFAAMQGSVEKYLEVIEALEHNNYYVNNMPYGEPQLGKRGLYPNLGSQKSKSDAIKAILWTLNMSDGSNDLFDISNRSEIPVSTIIPVIEKLLDNGILSIKQ